MAGIAVVGARNNPGPRAGSLPDSLFGHGGDDRPAADAAQSKRCVRGSESESSYLERNEPTYRVGRWIGAHLARNARLVGQDHRGFYIPREYAMELAYRRRTGLGSRGETAEVITDTLRRDGFTHLLLCPPDPEDAVEFDPTLSRKLAPWLKRHAPIYRESITDPDGVTRRYAIYDLDERLPEMGAAARVIQ